GSSSRSAGGPVGHSPGRARRGQARPGGGPRSVGGGRGTSAGGCGRARLLGGREGGPSCRASACPVGTGGGEAMRGSHGAEPPGDATSCRSWRECTVVDATATPRSGLRAVPAGDQAPAGRDRPMEGPNGDGVVPEPQPLHRGVQPPQPQLGFEEEPSRG